MKDYERIFATWRETPQGRIGRLPDLPNAGYATIRERLLTDLVMYFMREVERDRVLLLSIVIDGPSKWKKLARDKWSVLEPADDLLDDIYLYFLLQARLGGDDLEAQRDNLVAMQERRVLPYVHVEQGHR